MRTSISRPFSVWPVRPGRVVGRRHWKGFRRRGDSRPGERPSASPCRWLPSPPSGRPALGAAAAVVDLAVAENLWRSDRERFWASAMRGIGPIHADRGSRCLLYGDALCQVSGLVDVAAALGRDEIGEELQRDDIGMGDRNSDNRRTSHGRVASASVRSPSLIRAAPRVLAMTSGYAHHLLRAQPGSPSQRQGSSCRQGDRPCLSSPAAYPSRAGTKSP